MAVQLDRFLQRLLASGIISAEDVQSVLDGIDAERPDASNADVSQLLVKSGKVTPYQATQLTADNGEPLVLGNYIVLEKLGQGGMGVVYKAQHRRMKRLVALKMLSASVTGNPEVLRRFQREVEAAARLDHPNIVTAYDADEANGTHFLVMQYVAGTDLFARVRADGPLSVDSAIKCILQAARGLDYAHTHGIVHRDIKPANLLLDEAGTVKILDMGLARVDAAGTDHDQLTGSGQIMGTADYMAPEQAVDSKSVDARADIYSLGVTFWFLLTGRPLYSGSSLYTRMRAHQTDPIPSLRSACPQVSAELEAVFVKMVAKTPEARYQSMREVIVELGRSESGRSVDQSGGERSGSNLRFGESHSGRESSAIPAQTATARKHETTHVAEGPTLTYAKSASDTNPGGLPFPAGIEKRTDGPSRSTANRSWFHRRWLATGGALVLAIGAIAFAASSWVGSGPNRPNSADEQRSSASQRSSPPETSAVVTTPGQVIPLIPRLKPERLADGHWSDITISGDRVTFDTSHKRSQVWHDFSDITARRMTLRTKLRIDRMVTGGYAKLVFLNHVDPDYFVLLSDFANGRQTLCIASQSSGKDNPLTPIVSWTGQGDQFVELAFVLSESKLQVQLDGKRVGEANVTLHAPCHLAINVGGWKCEFERPEVIIDK